MLQELALDKKEVEVTILKKSFWRFPTEAKMALGNKGPSDKGYEACQFTVQSGDVMEIRLVDDELEIWIGGEKKIGEAKHYSLETSCVGKYALKVGLEVAKLAIGVAGVVV